MAQIFSKKSRIPFCACVLLSSYLLLSCSTTSQPSQSPSFFVSDFVSDETLLVKEDARLTPPETLNGGEVAQDASILYYAFSNAYGGRNFIPAPDFRKLLMEIAQLRDSRNSTITTQSFCQQVASFLITLPDSHLSASLSGQDCNKKHDQLSESGAVGKNIGHGKTLPWDISVRQVRGKTVSIIAITRFPKHEDAQWNGFLDAVFRAKKSSDAIIIDLRGNEGGDDTMGRRMASYLYGQDFPSPIESTIKSQTPATFAIAANNIRLRIIRLKQQLKPVPDYLEERLRKILFEFQEAKAGQLDHEKVIAGEAGNPFNQKKAFAKSIYILIDRGCQSSCESTLEAFEAHPYVTTIGENTGGFVQFGNMGQVVLPNSKIVVQMATDFSRYKDGRSVEKIGYAPKRKVPIDGDALQVALSLVQ
jgi:hypothetical protein